MYTHNTDQNPPPTETMAGKTTPAFYKDFNKPADSECCLLAYILYIHVYIYINI